ncbi:MAG: ATP-binding protein [Candidatus Omnitrophica bacterium]|nr:ATP-binding protein [Candidatus Omnitrophota bacterium]
MKDKKQRDESKIEIALEYGNSIIATLREPFLVLDKNLRVISANQSFYATFEVAEKDTIGRPLTDLGDRQWNIPKLLALLKEIIPGKKVVKDYEVEHKFEQIGQRTMIVNACQLRVPKKIAAMIAAIAREEEEEEEEEEELILLAIEDITEHKKAEQIVKEMREKVIRSEKLVALGKLAGAVAHELRNPLGVIRNSVYFLKLKLASAAQDEKIKKHFDILNEEVVNSDRIITNILTFGRIKIPELALVDIPKIIQANLDKLKVPANIKVTKQFEPGLPRIQADAVQMQQVFFNITVNAIQAMPGGGRFTISAKIMDEFIELGFTDTGEGISKENLKKIFEPLFSTRTQGTGLGLTVCQDIVEAHKGNINVESEAGKGTKFTIKLPITEEV